MNIDDAERLRRIINRLARGLNASATDENLTPTQASVLGLIDAKGPLAAGTIAEVEHLNATLVSRVLARLDELGLVRRTQDERDMRVILVAATGLGSRTNARIRRQRADVVRDAAAPLTGAQLSSIRSALPALESMAESI